MERPQLLIFQLINNDLEAHFLNVLILNNILLAHAADDDFVTSIMCQLSLRDEHIRIDGYFEDWIHRYLEYDFFSLFRMTRKTFSALFAKIDCEEFHQPYTGGFEQINGEQQLMITLWWLGKGETLISISDKFNIAVSTAFECTRRVLLKILELQNNYIVWPDVTEVAQVENDFRVRGGYPGVIGAIDVCNIQFKAPTAHQEDYIDRKMQHSIKLQAIVSANKIFTNISVGFPGSAHDARVFRNSGIFHDVEENGNYSKFFLDERYHILGDSAYPLLNWVMTPYRDNGRLNATERFYNTQHSKTRIVVEHTFGLLKSRWRILKYINVNSVEKAVQIIATCCILHNFCYVNSDVWENYEPIINNDPADIDMDDNIIRNLNRRAEMKRNEIANSL